MEIRHLVTFLQVAALESFTKAGETLGYSQANVSIQIRQLEKELGVPLFDRIGKRAHLTQFGQILVGHAQQLVSSSVRIETLFLKNETLGGNLRIGFVESLFECLFADTLLHYHGQFPLVSLEITVDATSELLKRLRTGQLDIVCLIDSSHFDSQIHYWETVECGIVIVAGAGHPLCERPEIRPSDLEEGEFILMEDTAPYVLDFQHWLLREQIRIRPFLKLQSPRSAIDLVSRSDYLSVLPDYSVEPAIREGRIRRLNVAGFTQTQTVQFLVHKNKVLTPQIEGFLRLARLTFRDYTSDIRS